MLFGRLEKKEHKGLRSPDFWTWCGVIAIDHQNGFTPKIQAILQAEHLAST
jgi:hypothetical protein